MPTNEEIKLVAGFMGWSEVGAIRRFIFFGRKNSIYKHADGRLTMFSTLKRFYSFDGLYHIVDEICTLKKYETEIELRWYAQVAWIESFNGKTGIWEVEFDGTFFNQLGFQNERIEIPYHSIKANNRKQAVWNAIIVFIKWYDLQDAL
jgi:hypothetical protein